MKKPALVFALLCFAAYAAQIVDCIALNTTGDAGIIIMLDILWFGLLLTLAIWSLASFWGHWLRAMVGIFVCALCYLQHVENTKIIW
jgi:hypothetical protein